MVKSRTNTLSDRYDQKQSGDFRILSLRRVFKLVLNEIYFTWSHNCRRDSHSKLKIPEAKIKIWKILPSFVSIW